jgi:hypothetical protein
MVTSPKIASDDEPTDRRSGSVKPRTEVNEDKGKGSVSNW